MRIKFFVLYLLGVVLTMALSIKAEEIIQLNDVFSVSNSLITSILIVSLLVIFFMLYERKISILPTKFQLFLEIIIESLYKLGESILGNKIKKIFPIVFTFFIYILISNWFGLLPITGSIGIAKENQIHSKTTPILLINTNNKNEQSKDYIAITDKYEILPFFRSPSADLNYTISLALISFILIQYISLKEVGIPYLGKFFDYRVKIGNGWNILLLPFNFIVNFIWKNLELVLELSKILSFSFRLFGNIFAGEVLLAVITTLSFGILTMPFLGFELFVSFIQSLIFIFLTMVFIKVNLDTHH